MKHFHINEPFRKYFADERSFDDFYSIPGTPAKTIDNRRTRRFERYGKGFFIKSHSGVGWTEITRNVAGLRLPVFDARAEWQAIHKIRDLGLKTLSPVAYGVDGANPANRRSFIITEALGATASLEVMTADWGRKPPNPALKRVLIRELARIARTLHENGVNHRDFYLCHFLVAQDREDRETTGPAIPELYLIDLHRAQMRKKTPERWKIKDLSGLYFSSSHIALSRQDKQRFIDAYENGVGLRHSPRFWHLIEKKAAALHRKLMKDR